MSAQGISSGSSSEACYLLVDNGSLRPRATLWLRCLAEALSLRTGERVEPVSLLHSHKVDAAELGGRRAEIFEPAVRKRAGAGQRVFVVVPLFFGPSEALNDYLPKRIAQLKEAFEGLQVAVAPPLVRPGMPGDDRVARVREARAEMEARRVERSDRSARLSGLAARFDADGDGRLSPDERMHAVRTLRAESRDARAEDGEDDRD